MLHMLFHLPFQTGNDNILLKLTDTDTENLAFLSFCLSWEQTKINTLFVIFLQMIKKIGVLKKEAKIACCLYSNWSRGQKLVCFSVLKMSKHLLILLMVCWKKKKNLFKKDKNSQKSKFSVSVSFNRMLSFPVWRHVIKDVFIFSVSKVC